MRKRKEDVGGGERDKRQVKRKRAKEKERKRREKWGERKNKKNLVAQEVMRGFPAGPACLNGLLLHPFLPSSSHPV